MAAEPLSPIREPRLRLSQLCHSIGATERAVGHWLGLDRRQTDSRGWRRFSLVDVASLSIVRTLIGWGYKFKDARDLSAEALEQFAGDVVRDEAGTPTALGRAFVGRFAFVFTGGPGTSLITFQPPHPDGHNHYAGEAFLTLDLGVIVLQALERAREAERRV
jgi:hypothetical protein